MGACSSSKLRDHHEGVVGRRNVWARPDGTEGANVTKLRRLRGGTNRLELTEITPDPRAAAGSSRAPRSGRPRAAGVTGTASAPRRGTRPAPAPAAPPAAPGPRPHHP